MRCFAHTQLTAETGLNLFIWILSPNHVCNFSISQNIYKKRYFQVFFFSSLFIVAVVTATFKDDEPLLTSCSPVFQKKFMTKKKSSSHPSFLSYTHFKTAYSFFSPIVLHLSAFRKTNNKLNLFLACFQLQTGSQELVCLLRGSDIFALQEVQLQHHQIVQMPDQFGLPSLALFSKIVESLQASVKRTSVPNNTKSFITKWKQSVIFSVLWQQEGSAKDAGRILKNAEGWGQPALQTLLYCPSVGQHLQSRHSKASTSALWVFHGRAFCVQAVRSIPELSKERKKCHDNKNKTDTQGPQSLFKGSVKQSQLCGEKYVC